MVRQIAMVGGQRRRAVFFFNDTATTEIYTRSLRDALPILRRRPGGQEADGAIAGVDGRTEVVGAVRGAAGQIRPAGLRRSEEHTSELQSRQYLVCRLLLEKKIPHRRFSPHPILPPGFRLAY